MKKSVNVILILALFLIAAVAISGCAQYGQQAGQQAGRQQQEQVQQSEPVAPPAPPATPEETPEAPQQPTAASEKTIEITAAGFSPNSLTVQAGDTVIFVNKDTAQHWPASAVHPTHVVYPESGGCIGSKFDACKGLAEGESFTFVFNEKGSWKYHDHLNPSLFGTVVVE